MSYLEQQVKHSFQAGDIIFKEQDPGSSMFIIQSGRVEVSTMINQNKVVLAQLGEGSIFGEMSLVDNRPRSATVVALTEVKCIEINRLLFKQRMEEIPTWMQSFYQILIERLREANKSRRSLEGKEVAKQIVFLLSLLLSRETPNSLGKVAVPWKESSEIIAFLLNIPLKTVDRIMNKLSLTPLARGEVNYERGRLFACENYDLFQRFSEYCKELYLNKIRQEASLEFEEQSPKELQFLKLLGKLMSEQATANDIHRAFLEERCEKDLGKSLSHYEHEMKELMRRGLLTSRLDENEDRYYDVDRDLLNLRLGKGETLEMFKKIESKLE